MKSRDFVYWLQGFFEIQALESEEVTLSKAQVECIQKHLNMVFHHEIDPEMGNANHQIKLSEIHEGNSGVYFNPNPELIVKC